MTLAGHGRIALYALGVTAMSIISLIAANNLWLFLGWLVGVAFVLWVDDNKIFVMKEPSNKMLRLNRNTWYDD